MNTDYIPVNPLEHGQYNSLWLASNPINNELAAKSFAAFASKSDVPIEKLRIIWQLSTTHGAQIMIESQFYTALRYICLYQNNYVDINSQLLSSTKNMSLKPPRFSLQDNQHLLQQQVPQVQVQVQATTPNYSLTPTDHSSYHNIFMSYDKDGDGYLTSEESVSLFKKSKLNEEQLAQIWSLADADEDGQLTSKEFCVAFHLIICVGKRNMPLPEVLPIGIQNFIDNFPIVPGGAIPTRNSSVVSPVNPSPAVHESNSGNLNNYIPVVNAVPVSDVIPAANNTQISVTSSPSSLSAVNKISNMNSGNFSDLTSSSDTTNTTSDDLSMDVDYSNNGSSTQLSTQTKHSNVIPIDQSNLGTNF